MFIETRILRCCWGLVESTVALDYAQISWHAWFGAVGLWADVFVQFFARSELLNCHSAPLGDVHLVSSG